MDKLKKQLPIVAFILSLLCGNIISLVLGIFALKKNKTNKSYSIAAIVISIIEIFAIVFIIYNWNNNKKIVSNVLCSEAYECKKTNDNYAECKYKNEENKVTSIKCYIDDNISAQIIEEKNESNFENIIKKEFKDNNDIISKTFIIANNELYAKMPTDSSINKQIGNPTIAKFNNEVYYLVTPNVSECYIVQDDNLEYMFYKSFSGKMFYINNYKNSTSTPFETIFVRELKEISKMDSENIDNTIRGYGEDSHELKTYINDFISNYSRFK